MHRFRRDCKSSGYLDVRPGRLVDVQDMWFIRYLIIEFLPDRIQKNPSNLSEENVAKGSSSFLVRLGLNSYA